MMADLDTMEEVPLETLPGEITLEEEKFEPSRLDILTRKKIGNISDLFDWMPDDGEKRSFFSYKIAAAIAVVLGLGALLWIRPQPHATPVAVHPFKAMLHWRLGRVVMDSIALEEIKQDTPYKAGALQIARMGNEFFVRQRQDPKAAQGDTIVYHFNVKGNEEIQIFFEDATRMQLAANSDLTFQEFPPGTTQKERELECNGEVLVNVAPNYQLPTIIKTRRARIAVLGTLFKLRDYSSEDSSAVFCYNGRVAVKDPGAATEILDGGQRATIRLGRGIDVSSNDFPVAVWSSKELVFDFSNDNLNDAMHEIARWYGMPEVKFDLSVDKTTRGMVYSGPISRYLTLQQLLNILERKGVHFSIQGQEILVEGTNADLSLWPSP